MNEKYRYQMISAPDEETLLEAEERDDGHMPNGSAIMNGETRMPQRNNHTPSIRRAKFNVDNGNSHVYQRIAIKGGGKPRFYLYYRAKRWYVRPAFIFTACIFAVTFLALLLLKWSTIEPLSDAELDERIETTVDYTNAHLIRVKRLPRDERLRPAVANGQLGYAVGTNQLSIAGVFNGEKSSSHIARIPMPIEIEIAPPVNKSEWTVIDRFHALDLLNGIYSETIALRNVRLKHTANVTKSVYAHRAYNDLIVMELSLVSEVAVDVVDVPLKFANSAQQLSSPDVEFQPTVESSTVYKFLSTCTARGRTRQSEFANAPQQDVVLMWICRQPDANQERSMVLWTGSPEVLVLAAGNDLTRVNNTFFTHQPIRGWLGISHRAAWNALWSSANISVQHNTIASTNMHRRHKRHDMGDTDPVPKPKQHVSENFRLAQTVYAAQYYLWSEIPLEFGGSSDDVWVAQTKNQLQRFNGVSRSGLAHAARPNCYSGHVFWDHEMWMMPTLTAMHPHMAQIMLSSRIRMLPAARQNAQSTPGGAGARYAWESAQTGREVASDGQKALNKLHVSCGISAALANYARSGGNLSALSVTIDQANRFTAMDMAVDIASFFVTRLSCSKSSDGHNDHVRRHKRHGDDEDMDMEHDSMDSHGMTMDSHDNNKNSVVNDGKPCHIRNVIGPDESNSPVDDSYYTNACAIQALLLPSLLCNRTQGAKNIIENDALPSKSFCTLSATVQLLQKFENYAAKIHMPLGKFNASWYYHPEFDGYDPLPASKTKQPGVVLVPYPLGYHNDTNWPSSKKADVDVVQADDSFNSDLRRHDLYVYEAATASTDAATALSAFCVGFSEITDINSPSPSSQNDRDRALAAKYFRRQVEHVRGPFYTWSEQSKKKSKDNMGAVNFLPGIGGFLQSIVNGYAGLRYASNEHMLLKVGLLPNAMEYAVNGIYFHNVQFNVRVMRKSSGVWKNSRTKRHGDEDENSEHNLPVVHSSNVQMHSSGMADTDEPNVPFVVEITWHKPRTYEALMQQWMHRPGVVPSTPMNAEKPTTDHAVRTKRHADDEQQTLPYTIHICHNVYSSSKNASAMRDKRHGDDEDDDDLPPPPTAARKAVTVIPQQKAFSDKIKGKIEQSCQELQYSDRAYTFSPDVDGKVAVFVRSRT